MIKTHKVFLVWLLYATLIVFSAGAAFYTGIPQLIVSYDHSHLTIVLFFLYVVAELLSGRQAWKISKEQNISNETLEWLNASNLKQIVKQEDSSVMLCSENYIKRVALSYTSTHISNLVSKASETKINQTILLEATEDRIYQQISMTEFIGSRIVWIGIFATILGVIMAFWPLLQTGFDIETMKNNLGGFFGGIAVAFLPTAVSFIFKIVLDVNNYILEAGVSETMNNIAVMSETKILPFLENK